MKYKYFVYYRYRQHGFRFEGSVDVMRENRITSMEDVQKIQDDIADKFDYDDVLIINWRKFEDED